VTSGKTWRGRPCRGEGGSKKVKRGIVHPEEKEAKKDEKRVLKRQWVRERNNFLPLEVSIKPLPTLSQI
jgi:hypothetical protein